MLERALDELAALELPEAGGGARHELRPVAAHLLDPALAQLLEAEPGGAAALVEPALGGGVDPALVEGRSSTVGSGVKRRLEGPAAVARDVDARDRPGVAQRRPAARRRRLARAETRVLVIPSLDGRKVAAPSSESQTPEPSVARKTRSGRFGCQAMAWIASAGSPVRFQVLPPSVGDVEAGDGAGEQPAVGQGGEARRAPLLEALLEALPLAAAVERAVDPAAGGGPDLAGALRDRGQAEDLGVEDHALEDAGPGRAAVVAAVGAPPGAGDDRVRLRRDRRAGW